MDRCSSITANTGGKFDGLTLQFLLGLLFAPFAWLTGTPLEDAMQVGDCSAAGHDEFMATPSWPNCGRLGLRRTAALPSAPTLVRIRNLARLGFGGGYRHPRSGQRKNLAELAWRALLGGTVACQ